MAISYWPKSWIQRPTIWETVNVYVLVRSKSPRIQLPCRLAPECQYLFQSWFTKFKGMHIHISLETIVCGYYGMWFEYSFFFETSRTDLAATIEAGILLDLKKIWIGTRLTPAFTGTPLLDMEFDHHYVSTLQTFMNPWTKKFRSFMKKKQWHYLCFFLWKVSHKGHSLFISTKPANLCHPPKFAYFFHLPCRIEIWPCGQNAQLRIKDEFM